MEKEKEKRGVHSALRSNKHIKKNFLKGFANKVKTYKETNAIGSFLENEKRFQMNFNRLLAIHEDHVSWIDSMRIILENRDKRDKADYDPIMLDLLEKNPLPPWTTRLTDSSSWKAGTYMGLVKAKALSEFYENKLTKLKEIVQTHRDYQEKLTAILMKNIEQANLDEARFDIIINNTMNED